LQIFHKSILAICAALSAASLAQADPICAPFSGVAEDLPLIYLDRADPMAARVAQSLEDALLKQKINTPEAGALKKIYCDIGMFEMRIRFEQPSQDDAVRALVTEAIYTWDSAQEPAGWMLSNLSSHAMCARGDVPFASVCP
jgi:hypothetical protein